MNKTLVIGVGNSILSDDGVGLEVIKRIKDKLPEIEFRETANLGLDILDYVTNFDRVVIVDSIKTLNGIPGSLYKLSIDDLKSTFHLTSPHTVNLSTAIEMGEKLGLDMPEFIIYAIEIADNQTFSECLTLPLKIKLPKIVEKIIADLKGR